MNFPLPCRVAGDGSGGGDGGSDDDEVVHGTINFGGDDDVVGDCGKWSTVTEVGDDKGVQ